MIVLVLNAGENHYLGMCTLIRMLALLVLVFELEYESQCSVTSRTEIPCRFRFVNKFLRAYKNFKIDTSIMVMISTIFWGRNFIIILLSVGILF